MGELSFANLAEQSGQEISRSRDLPFEIVRFGDRETLML